MFKSDIKIDNVMKCDKQKKCKKAVVSRTAVRLPANSLKENLFKKAVGAITQGKQASALRKRCRLLSEESG